MSTELVTIIPGDVTVTEVLVTGRGEGFIALDIQCRDRSFCPILQFGVPEPDLTQGIRRTRPCVLLFNDDITRSDDPREPTTIWLGPDCTGWRAAITTRKDLVTLTAWDPISHPDVIRP